MNDPGFCVGTVCGFLYAGVIGWILSQMREARVKMGNRDRTLDKFPASLQPTLTPGGLVRSANEARLKYGLLFLALIAFSVGLPFGAYYLLVGG